MVPAWVLLLGITGCLALLWHGNRRLASARDSRPLPPGPVPLPLVGNVLDVPRRHFGHEYRELAAKYGEARRVYH